MFKFIVSDKFQSEKENLLKIIRNFDQYVEILGTPSRNIIKKIPFQDYFIAVKSFKKPHLANKLAYRHIRPSKAKRSFVHGQKLLALGISNPEPIAFLEDFDSLGLTLSFYISKFSPYDFTLRELYTQSDGEKCAKAFAEFSYFVHTKGVFIKDNTPGNTLIVRKNNGYEMSLVDLNRMGFYENLTFDQKMRSLSDNIREQPYFDIITEEYARISGSPTDEIRNKIYYLRGEIDKKRERKAKFKEFLKKF
ncbi:MAG: hypothetical protein LBT29_07065 [Flavobacteriaceae bacterium]|jgi:hypothetical protein|nr:hypothetical protein [Flavobacteriaceae bacterium]